MLTQSAVISHTKKMHEAIIHLRDKGHYEAALMLLYAAIDQMAWLSIPGEISYAKDFKAWVNKFMLDKNPDGLLEVSAHDLWGARCGLLHTAAPESRDLSQGTAKNKIFYSVGHQNVKTTVPGAVVIGFEALAISFAAAVPWFLADLQSDSEQEKNAQDKLKRMLVFQET